MDLPLQFLNYCAKVYIALSCVCVKLLDGPRTMYLFTVSIVFKVWEFSHRSVSAVVRMLCMKYIRHTCCLALSGMVWRQCLFQQIEIHVRNMTANRCGLTLKCPEDKNNSGAAACQLHWGELHRCCLEHSAPPPPPPPACALRPVVVRWLSSVNTCYYYVMGVLWLL